MKKLVGYTMIFIPLVLVFIAFGNAIGLEQKLKMFGCMALVFGWMATAAWLLTG
jgi:hypothetical protein